MSSDRPDWGSVMPPDEGFLARTTAEPAIAPDIPIVDTHVHLWRLFADSPYFVPELATDIAESGHTVISTVYVECNAFYRALGPAHLKAVGETEHAVGQAAIAASGIYTSARIAEAIVGFADLRLGDRVAETLEAHVEAANGRFRGIRQRAKWDADPVVRGRWTEDRPELYLDAAFNAGLKRLTAKGLSFDASVFHPQIPEVTALARAHPDASIVLNHTGSPLGHGAYAGKPDENHANWLNAMRTLASCPNVSVKLGGLLMNLANYDFSTAAKPPTSAELATLWRPYIEPCIELFGAERCMVSSNFPVDRVGFGYRTVWNMFKRLTAGCSSDEKRLLFSETARRVYRLEG
ncbi:MAG: amidohydrolase family protein [Gammaproteobacteria bacterium]|nr:amidohydrolase family protein [Gammaproteobacteria bacterium]